MPTFQGFIEFVCLEEHGFLRGMVHYLGGMRTCLQTHFLVPIAITIFLLFQNKSNDILTDFIISP